MVDKNQELVKRGDEADKAMFNKLMGVEPDDQAPYTPKYKRGQKWDVDEYKMILVDAPKTPEGLYEYLLFDEDSFYSGTPQKLTVSESYIDYWIQTGAVSEYTPFPPQVINVPVPGIRKPAKSTVSDPGKISVYQIPRIPHALPHPSGLRRRLVGDVGGDYYYTVYDLNQFAVPDDFKWSWELVLDTCYMLTTFADADVKKKYRTSKKYESIQAFHKNYNRVKKTVTKNR